MFVDARALPADEKLEADICIVGAGPAGIALCIALAGEGRRVVLIESGDLEAQASTQSLNEGEVIGIGYRIRESRLRCFGGSGNHWRGNCRALDSSNFAARSWIPNSGWPFGRSELDPYYERARLLCKVEQNGPTADNYRVAGGTAVPWSEPLETAVWQFSPSLHFGEAFRSEFEAAPGITVLLNATLTKLRSSGDGRTIISARFSTFSGTHFTVGARRYVLACGGIENARLLLAMADDGHPCGLGNEHDLVGRYFMEHPEMPIGTLAYNRPTPMGLRHSVSTSTQQLLEGFRLSDKYQRKAKIGDAAFWPLSIAEMSTASDVETTVGRTVQDLSSVLAGASASGSRTMTNVTLAIEQSPDPDSRVTLGEGTDSFGMRRVRLDWRLNAVDRRTFATALKAIKIEPGRQRIGRFWLRPPLRNLDLDDPNSMRLDMSLEGLSERINQLDTELCWGCHHMGTTRMHPDAHFGAVDANCRVHSIANLYVAGSSVFPTAGVSNPTLTIMALALRLGHHLAAK